jgi:hypothetical protein
VNIQLSEDLSGIQEMLVINDSIAQCQMMLFRAKITFGNSLFCVPSEKSKIENKGEPVSVEEEQGSQESVHGSFGYNIGI